MDVAATETFGDGPIRVELPHNTGSIFVRADHVFPLYNCLCETKRSRPAAESIEEPDAGGTVVFAHVTLDVCNTCDATDPQGVEILYRTSGDQKASVRYCNTCMDDLIAALEEFIDGTEARLLGPSIYEHRRSS